MLSKIKSLINGHTISHLDDSISWKERAALLSASLVATYVLIFFLSVIYACFAIHGKDMIPSDSEGASSNVNILVLGVDIGDAHNVSNESVKRTDTMMLMNYNKADGALNIVSIPRDVLVKSKSGSNLKLNAVLAEEGYKGIKTSIEGMTNVKINYIVKIDYNGFRDIIDSIGGVKVTIQRNMKYDDEGQNLHIDFKKGETVTLDGKKAEEYFRWRKNNDGTGFANGDLDRIQSQHDFISKVMKKCTSPIIIPRLPLVIKTVSDSVETNMTSLDIINYGFKFRSASKNKLNMYTLSGIPKMIRGQSYLVYDKNQNKDVLSMLASSKASSASSMSKSDIRIKVLNATKIDNLASSAKEELKSKGYKNIDTGNTETTNKSVIMSNNKSVLESVKSDINISKTDSKSKNSEYDDYDAVIVLGKDYKKLEDTKTK